MEAKKREVQERFKRQTGLLIDIVKQGHGTTNDGNTARRFFADSATSASITGVDENRIRRFSVILETLSKDAQSLLLFTDESEGESGTIETFAFVDMDLTHGIRK